MENPEVSTEEQQTVQTRTYAETRGTHRTAVPCTPIGERVGCYNSVRGP